MTERRRRRSPPWLSVLLVPALVVTGVVPAGNGHHPVDAWLVITFDAPALVVEGVHQQLGLPAALALTRLLPAPAFIDAGPGLPVVQGVPGYGRFADWDLDLQAPAVVSYAWFPSAHTLVARVGDPDAAAGRLRVLLTDDGVERMVGGIRLFRLGPVAAALRDDWLVVANDEEMAHRLAGTTVDRLPNRVPRQSDTSRLDEMSGKALPLRVELRLSPARQAMAPIMVARTSEEIDSFPDAGPLSRQRLAVGALLSRSAQQADLMVLRGFVTRSGLVLKAAGEARCPVPDPDLPVGEPGPGDLVLTGAGSAFHRAAFNLPLVVAALGIPQDAAAIAGRKVVLEAMATAEADMLLQIKVGESGQWRAGAPAGFALAWLDDGFLLQWAGIGFFHDATPAAGGSCMSFTPVGLERLAARLKRPPTAW